jgi:hypothetical protein
MADKLIIACDGGEQTLYVGKINSPHPSMHLPMAGSAIVMRDTFQIKTLLIPAQNEEGKIEMVQKIQVIPIGFAYGGVTINICPTWVSDPTEDEKGMNKLVEHITACKDALKIQSAKDAGLIVDGLKA